MEFTTKTTAPEKLKTGTLVMACYAGGELTEVAEHIDQMLGGMIRTLLTNNDLPQAAGSVLVLPAVVGLACDRILLVSLGKAETYDEKAWYKVIQAVAQKLASGPATEAAICLQGMLPSTRDSFWLLQHAARTLGTATYCYRKTLSQGVTEPKLKKITFISEGKIGRALSRAIDSGAAVADGMNLARELGNLPANICTPAYLAQTAEKLGKEFDFKVKVLERKEMERLGMGAALSVAAGSRQPPKFIVMQYKGKGVAGKTRPVVLVGKGVTFDSGGISLKPAADMDEMKFDMCGAASVLGTFRAVAAMALPIHLVGLIPSSENLPDGNATKPGDIVTSMSGQTIEIVNTDAEGRLLLCDALTYAERFEPACVIDIATLTGAIIIALGKQLNGLMSNDIQLAKELRTCAELAADPLWQLPLWEEYQEQLKSNFADMSNSGGRAAGSITAACFLARFTRKYPWAHLDIAGTAWKSGDAKGATGRPVPLLCEFLIQRAQTKN